MKKSTVTWSVKQYVGSVAKGTISFDYPIQREGGQWGEYQKSLLIHSLAGDFPVPALYAIPEKVLMEVKGKDKEVTVYHVLDGKQRLTNMTDFITGAETFPKLHDDTPTVTIDDEEYVLAGKSFEELDEEVKMKIHDFSLTLYKIDEATDEEIEDMFYRLNNGTPLSKQQQAKAKMGTEWAIKIKGLVQHSMMQEKAHFTPAQLRKADNEVAILQTMMLIDESHTLESISSNDVAKYALTFKEDEENKDALVAKILVAMDYLDKAIEEKDKTLLAKVHFPMTLITALKAIELGVEPHDFGGWADDFKKAISTKHSKDAEVKTNYNRYRGQGSVKKNNTLGRMNEMVKHLEKYAEHNDLAKAEKVEPQDAEEKEIMEVIEELNKETEVVAS